MNLNDVTAIAIPEGNVTKIADNVSGETLWEKSGGKLYLYNKGSQCTDVTGGWSGYAIGNNDGWDRAAPSVVKGDEYITATIDGFNNPQKLGYLSHATATDMSQYSKVIVHVSGTAYGTSRTAYAEHCGLVILSSLTSETSLAYKAIIGNVKTTTTFDETVELDISNINTNAYVAFLLRPHYSKIELNVIEVYLKQ